MNRYSSLFGPYIEEFIALKVASGFQPITYKALKDFDKWCTANCPEKSKLDMDMIFEYARKREIELPSTQRQRVNVLRAFSTYLCQTGKGGCTVPERLAERDIKHAPYIFSDKELKAFFNAVDHIEASPTCPNKDIVLPVMLRLAYCCGLRPQEVRNILLSDISFKDSTLFVRKSKNNKDRKIVMSKDMCRLLMKYVAVMSCRQHYSTYLFERPEGGPYRQRWLSINVADCYRMAGLKPHGKATLRAYDLRHNFATTVINKWHEENRNIDNSMVVLSEYMGHEHLDDTLYYITLTPVLFEKWSQFNWYPDDFASAPEEDYWNE